MDLTPLSCSEAKQIWHVIRKEHVSSNHVRKDHTESDYVEILSDMMKKAYPTMTYNDLQCQIGGCQKEYRGLSSRRSHVLRIHFKNELSCPLNCSYRSNDFSLLNSHLKEDHGLPNGHMSIDSHHVREQFNAERSKHNFLLNSLVLRAFPCPIPDCYKSNFKSQSSVDISPGDPSGCNVISNIREKSRKFQDAPPNPLRLRSPSSDSDSSSDRNEDSEGMNEVNDTPAKTAKVLSPAKTKGNQRGILPQQMPPTTSSSSNDEQAYENSSATASKDKNASDKNASKQSATHLRTETKTVTNQRRVSSSSSSSSSSTSSLSPIRSSKKPPPSTLSTSGHGRDNREGKERPRSNQSHGANNGSSSSDSESSTSDDDVTVVKTVKSPSTRTSLARTSSMPVLGEVVLDYDDDKEDDDIAHVTSKEGKKTPEKKPLYRRLAISGVSVPIEKTPLSSFGKAFCNSEGRSTAYSTDDRAQMEKGRRAARKMFNLAELHRAKRMALKKKRGSNMNNEVSEYVEAETTKKGSKKRKKAASQNCSSKRSASTDSKEPSYVVKKVKRESSVPRENVYHSTPRKGASKRFA
ncbi:unnamed protein product [Haemonchus placei]|uniref:C2H2-type domain-containing protein n=1 Tax=Haemonchus placei TaxID=6290 RepID=A0A0N4WY27_HAEPC|nr:unnamed protein product [Haemonchus placei]